jgi:hypothetical protein
MWGTVLGVHMFGKKIRDTVSESKKSKANADVIVIN